MRFCFKELEYSYMYKSIIGYSLTLQKSMNAQMGHMAVEMELLVKTQLDHIHVFVWLDGPVICVIQVCYISHIELPVTRTLLSYCFECSSVYNWHYNSQKPEYSSKRI